MTSEHRAAVPASRHLRHALYASGNTGKSAVWSFIEIFALFFMTDVLGVAPHIAGVILLISLVWDGVTDPLVGYVADRLRLRVNGVRLYFLIGAPIAAAAFIALFHAARAPDEICLTLIFAALIVFRTGYTIVDIPHNAALAFISPAPSDRTTIAGMRIFASAIGKLLVTATSLVLLDRAVGHIEPDRFALAAVGFAFVYLVFVAISLGALWRLTVPARADGTAFSWGSLWDGIWCNQSLQTAFGLTAITSLTTPLVSVAILYFGAHSFADHRATGVALTAMTVAQALSLPVWGWLAHVLNDKVKTLRLANGGLAIILACALAAPAAPPAALFIIAAGAGWALGGVYMLNWAVLPDAIDHGEQLGVARNDMSVFGLYTLVNKVCIGVSQAIAGWTLLAFGYEAGNAAGADEIDSIFRVLIAFALIGGGVAAWLTQYVNATLTAGVRTAAPIPQSVTESEVA